MSTRRYLLAISLGIIVAACGGSSAVIGDIPDSGSSDDANSDGTAADSAGNGETGTPSEGGSDASSDASSDSAMRVDGNDGGGCPNAFGGYAMETATGGGCGDINVTAKQCILHAAISSGSNACVMRFNSEQPVHPLAVNGPAGGVDLKVDGTFDPSTLILGTTNRSNCSGAWNEALQTMTVTCTSGGGCVITMVKSSATCP